MTVTFLDPALCAYIAPGGGVARLAGGGAATEAPTVTITTSTFGAVTDATLNLDGPTASVADIANARWRVTPNPAGYSSKTTLTGPVAVFKHDNGDGGTSEVSVRIPRLDGGPDIEASTTVTRATRSLSGLLPRTTTRGNEPLKIEAAFGFETARSGLTCRLVRTASPGIPTERTIIETRTVDFPAATGVALTREITFPPATGLGAGYQFHWEVDVAPGQRVVSKSMPMWVLGDDPRCAPQSLDVAPDALNYPAIYTRKASDSGVVTPAPGRTYQQHLDKFYYDWRADNLSSPVGGAWLSFNDYNSNIYWVDLDDPTVPKHRVEHWDVWQMGYVYPGWYGEDPWASPYPRNHVAVDVPIPHNASPSVGTDRSLCIVGLRNGQVEKIWEMWLAIKMADATWQAANIAVTTAADDWRHSRSYTVAAVGISALAYALRVKEAKAAIDYIKARRAAGQPVLDSEIIARIPHALAINIPRPYVGKVSYPGTFTDGSSSDTATMWEGQLVYLRSDIDVSSLNLSPLHHAIRVVGKHRGYRVTDQTAWSTTMIVEGDQAYGGGVWSAMLEPNESWKVIIPKDHFIIGKQYETKAAFDADTHASTPLLPAEVLDLAAWKVTLPVDSAGQLGNDRLAVEVKQPDLATYTSSYVKAAPDNQSVIFTAPVEGATTSGSEYPRCELREMRSAAENTANASWGFDDGGIHTMTITQAVLELPVAKPQLACGQIHDASDDNLIILADGFAPTTGTTAATGTSTIPYAIRWKWDGATQPDPLIPDYVTGQTFTIKIEVRDNIMRIWADKGTAAHTLRATKTGLVSTFPASSSSGCYFKAGVYAQSNTTNAGKTRPSALGGGPTGGDAPGVKAAVAVHNITVNHT